MLSGLSEPASALSADVPAARPHLRNLFESITRLGGQHVLLNYFHQRHDFLAEKLLGYSPEEPTAPQFHPLVAATMPVEPSDVLPWFEPPEPPSLLSLIPPPVQACVEALHILRSSSGADLRAAAKMCSPTVSVYFHDKSKSINLSYEVMTPRVPTPYPYVVESPTYSISSSDSEDSSESSSTYGDADIVSVVAEFISELQEQHPADAPSAPDSIAASGEEAVVPLAPP